ncbi:dihydropteroate synthase [Thiovibrio frasassiensis]|uniref:Dihydropteroate synthase n=1 Tax=Thiovibrio frasassiensis TaxID=2984131 RepID=A0A9X4MIR0_9BACT|nr:dihydropteroate synthase [Thiovibrio frasassiensis]MDG4477108.1 dihydropteroate synthase [Thiovibrio frasassiensis]
MRITTRNKTITFGPRPLVMGILNVTPDSFSDGGRYSQKEALSAQVRTMLDNGADLIDVGGESTRPYAEPVSEHEELQRVLPAIACIRALHRTIPISIDTTKAEVARQGLQEGADIINDVSGLRFDPAMVRIAIDYQAPVILMHMRKTPKDMQDEPVYDDVVQEIIDFLAERISWATAQGLDREQIIVDPGLGFGKTVIHNLTILKHLGKFKNLGCPLLVGHSRKGFIGKLLSLETQERDLATALLSSYCATQGADILRVHDVEKTVQAVRLHEAIILAP